LTCSFLLAKIKKENEVNKMSTLTQDRYFESKIIGLLSNPGNSRLVDENFERLKPAIICSIEVRGIHRG